MEIRRRKTKPVMVGKVGIGGNFPISIQSMTKTITADIKHTVRQIKKLEEIGCEIIRVAVKNEKDAEAIREIKKEIKIPLEADIHFNYRLALLAVTAGSDSLRLNPGNIYRLREIENIVHKAKERKIPIRVGVNSGSIRINRLRNKKITLSDLMVDTALDYIRILEKMRFFNIIVSLKASDVLSTVEAYRKMARLCPYPFHLGITATGLPFTGGIKSALGIGILLADGIGDTIRVSLAGCPEEEIRIAKLILSALNLRKFGPEIIACPTCGRAQIDVVRLAQELEEKLQIANCRLRTEKPLKIAIMGCEVNGPGEAKDADIGIAGGKHCGVLFQKGEIITRVKEKDIIKVLWEKGIKPLFEKSI
ncbi:MAG: flavodoxin-dependent (E)-4-hydroxy-3-methylbut-2-enyl-diphosphate synthase [Candidatus Omnitrophota bacterium]